MDTERVNAKARALMAPVLGAKNAEAVIQRVNDLEALKDVRELRPFLTQGTPARKKGRGASAKVQGKTAVRKAVKPAKKKVVRKVKKKAATKK